MRRSVPHLRVREPKARAQLDVKTEHLGRQIEPHCVQILQTSVKFLTFALQTKQLTFLSNLQECYTQV